MKTAIKNNVLVRKVTPYLPASLTRFMGWLFCASLVGRFAYIVCVIGPMHDINNDWGRHYYNGLNLFDAPTIMSGIDPKLYQFWVWVTHQLSFGSDMMMHVYAGLLCALMPVTWYLAATELFSKRAALILGLIISAHPSFLNIYSYFMNETLLLPLFGMAVWLTVRCARMRSSASFLICMFVWILTLHARMVVAPVMVLAVGWLLHYQKHTFRQVVLSCVMLCVVTAPAAYQSYRVLDAFVPFQGSAINTIYFHNDNVAHGYEITRNGRKTWRKWSSPSYYQNPYAPFGIYKTHRSRSKIASVYWNMDKGMDDLEREIARLKAQRHFSQILEDTIENTVFLFFAQSWPDSTNKNYWWYRLNKHLRWGWPVMMGCILMFGAFLPMRAERAFIVSSALALISVLALQQMGIMEGRYRKPLEPLLLFCMVILWQAGREKTLRDGLFTPITYGLHFYVMPIWDHLVRRIVRI